MMEWADVYFEWDHLKLLVVSFGISTMIALFGHHIPRLSGRAHDLNSVQCAHKHLTPRVGGIAIFVALGVSILFAPASVVDQYKLFIIATALLFAVGLLEDLGFDVSPRKRLLAAVSASLLVIALLGVWMPRTDVPLLDAVMQYWFIGIPVTLLVTAGMANAFNMIDGVNGLSSLTAIVAALAMALIAEQAGYTAMVQLAIMFAASIFGFFLINFPRGLVFLGDAGAYTIGFVLSWFGIGILLNVPDASPWAILMVLFWPVADLFLAFYRRSRRKADAMAPDRLHAHQMVMRALEICFLGRQGRRIANPLSTVLLAPFIIAPPVVGILLWDQTFLAFAAWLGCMGLFFGAYAAAPMVIRRFRRASPYAASSSTLQVQYSADRWN